MQGDYSFVLQPWFVKSYFHNCELDNQAIENSSKILLNFRKQFRFLFQILTFPYLAEKNNLLDALDSYSSDFAG